MPHTWKTTDSARRSGVSDYQRAGIKQTAEFLSADEATVTDLSLQVLYGNKQDPQVNNALSVVTDNLAFNNSSFRDPALRIAVDSSGRAIIGRNIKGPEYGRPDINYSFNIDNCGNMLFKTKDQYITRDTSTNLGFTINDNVGIRKDLYVDGSVDIWDIATLWKGKDSGSQALHVMGSTQMDNQLQFTTGDPCYNIITYIKDGDISTNGIATIGKDLAVGRNVSIGGVITTNVIMKKNLDVCGNTIIDGSLNVGGNTIIDGSLNVSRNTIIDSSLNVGGNTSIGGSTSIGGNTTITNGYFHLIDPSANPGSVHNADYNFWVDGSGFYYGNLHVKGNVTYDGSMSVIGTSTVTGDSIIKGDLEVIDDGGTNIGKIFVGTLKSNVSDVTERVIMGIDEHMVTGNKRSISVGHDNTNGNQSEMWFHYDSSGNSNNFGSIGLRGKPTLIAFNNEGKVSIGREKIPSSNFSSLNLPSILDISGTVNITGNNAGGYISQIPSLSINNTSLDDSAGASIELTAKRAYHAESKPGFTPQLTGADIILRNLNDANPSGGARVPTTKVHGVMKTFQTDNSWNRGDMVFYGQDTTSINAGTDSSGITEFLRFNSENQFVRFSKDIGIGGNVKPKSGDPVPTSYPSFPDSSAFIDARTYTYYGYENGDNWKAGDILLGCENQDAPISSRKPNGLLWKPLGGHLTPGKVFVGNYSKESAAIKFIPSDDYYRGGLGFFTNNTGDMTTDAVKRMEILSNGDISAVNQIISCKHLNTSTKLITKSALQVEGVGNRAYFDIVDASRIYFRRSETSTCSNGDEYMYADVSGVNVSTNLYVNGEIHGNLAVQYIGNLNNFGVPGKKINILGGLHVAESIDISSNAIIDGSLNVSGNISTNNVLTDKVSFNTGSFIDGTTSNKITFFNVTNVDLNDSDVSNIDNLDVSSIRIKAGNINFGSDDKYAINYNSDSSSVDIKTNGNNMMRIFEDRVGIGENISGPSPALLSITREDFPTSTQFGAGTLIHLGRSGAVNSAAMQTYGIGFGTYANSKYPPAWIGYEQKGTTSPNGYGDLIFKVKGAGVTDTDPTEVLRLAANGGYVGIGGVETPTYNLQVEGTGFISGELTVGGRTVINGDLFANRKATIQGNLVIAQNYTATVPSNHKLFIEAINNNDGIYIRESGTNALVELGKSNKTNTGYLRLYNSDVANNGILLDGQGPSFINGGGLSLAGVLTCENTLTAKSSATFAGNVGIGTTTPSHALEVDGKALIIGSLTANSSARFDGNVGIGIAPSTTAKLSVNGTVEFNNSLTVDGPITNYGTGTSNKIHTHFIYTDSTLTGWFGGLGLGFEGSKKNKVGIRNTAPSVMDPVDVYIDGETEISENLIVDGRISAQNCFIQSTSLNDTYITMTSQSSTNKQFELKIRDDTTSSYPLHIGPGTGFYGINIKHSNGYVGIGKNNPAAPLEVNGNILVNGGPNWGIYFGNPAVGPYGTKRDYGKAGVASNGDGQYLEFMTAGQNRHKMDSNGQVGINTLNPTSELAVNGKISLGYGGSSNNSWTTGSAPFYGPSIFSSDGTGGGYPFNAYGHLCLQSRTDNTSDIVFATGATPTVRMVIDGTGYVGIGTTTPDYPLKVASSRTQGTGFFAAYSPPLGPSYAAFYATSIGPAAYSFSNPYLINGGTSIYAHGGIVTEAAFVAVSDKRIKTNIIDVPDNLALEQVRNIDVRYYEYKDKVKKGTETTIGFIAQQVKEIVPSAVSIQKGIIPNEMRIIETPQWTEISDGSNNKFKLTISDLEDVSGNTKYRFYVGNDLSGNDECEKEIHCLEDEPNSFIFDQSWNNVFLYGKEVDDFHALDKQKLFALNFSATQEIDRIQQAEKTKLEAAESKIVTLENEVSTLKTQLAQVLARLDALET